MQSPDCEILFTDDSFINWYVTQLDISPYINILDLWYFLFEGGLWLPSSPNPTWLPIPKTLIKTSCKGNPDKSKPSFASAAYS